MVLLALVAGPQAFAQAQPPQATNQQDEVVQINRTADPDAESFRILRSGDKQELNRYVTKVYRLKHANPYEVLPYVRSIASLEKGNVATAWNPKAEGGPLSLVQVNVPEFQIPFIDAAITAYDVPDFASSAGDIKFSYRTKYRNAVDVADFIRTSTLSADGVIRADAATNTIYVSDSPSDFRRVLAQIQFYDVPTAQLDLELSLIELTDIDQTSLGLDWDAWKYSLGGSADFSSTSTHTEPGNGTELNTYTRAFDGFLSIDATAAARFLNYLVDRGKAKIAARTTVTVANGSVAKLDSLTGVPVLNYAYSAPQQKSNLAEAAPAEPGGAREGLSIALAPTIAMESAFLRISIDMRSPVGVAKGGAPIYSTQSFDSDLSLTPGTLYKIGGLRRKVEAKERKGFPLLRDVPVIKYLFSNEVTILRDTELYLFLRPTWTSVAVPALDAMQGDTPAQAPRVQDILSANPNVALSPEDAAMLQRYFDSGERPKP